MSNHSEYSARSHFGSLDGVRCLAIVAVVWHHSQDTGIEFFSRGFLGVDLFFVLSGFLIVTLLLRERAATGSLALGKFYMRRSLRIFPLYYGVLALLAGVYLLRPHSAGGGTFFDEVEYYVTYTSNWVHTGTTGLAITWSLAAEEQFYLVWPAFERWLRRRWLWGVLSVAILVNQAVNFGLLDGFWREVVGSEPTLEILDATFTPILLGVALAHILHRQRGFAAATAAFGARWMSVVLFLGLLGTIAAASGDISGWPRLSIQLLMTCFLASVVVREDHALAGIFQWAPIARVGVVSYGVYLLHNFGIALGQRCLGAVPALRFPCDAFVLGLSLSIVLAEISFRWYESGFLRLKRRFANH